MDVTPIGYTPPPLDLERVSETNPSRASHDDEEPKYNVKENQKDNEKSGSNKEQQKDQYEHQSEEESADDLIKVKPRHLKELPGDEAGQLIDVKI